VKQLINTINIINDEHGFPARKLMGFVVCVLESREINLFFFLRGEKQMD
jgi:hypothetical protein